MNLVTKFPKVTFSNSENRGQVEKLFALFCDLLIKRGNLRLPLILEHTAVSGLMPSRTLGDAQPYSSDRQNGSRFPQGL